MKKVTFLITTLLLTNILFAQQKFNKFLFDEVGNSKSWVLAPIPFNKSSPFEVYLSLDKSTNWISAFNANPSTPLTNYVFLKGTKNVDLKIRLHKDSLKLYRYTIIENDTNYLINGSIPSKVAFAWPVHSDFPNHVDVELGKFSNENKKLTVQLYKMPTKNKLCTIEIYNKPIKSATILSTKLVSIIPKKRLQIAKVFKDGDTLWSTNNKLLSISAEQRDMNFLYHLVLTRLNGEKSEVVTISNKWTILKKSAEIWISPQYFNKPGKYQAEIIPIIANGEGIKPNIAPTVFRFEVIENNKKVISIKQLALILFIFCVIVGTGVGLFVFYIRKKNNRKIANYRQQRELAITKLSSIRSQLNPHFMFNALSGIQNLMNKNKMEEAANYLSKFARLTRNVLDQNELISLIDERELLEDYLEMERLRFGFIYSIKIDSEIDVNNIEIPTMLLQPFLENAVKHGIAEMENQGRINISFEKDNRDLILKVNDNGQGFNSDISYNGFGLQLSKNRIVLLNSIYPETPFLLQIKSDDSGTKILITLTQWL